MNKINKKIKFSIIAIFILLFSFFTGCLNNSSDEKTYSQDFVFNLLNGEQKNIRDFAGKIVLIDFTGANCGYCVPQMFALEQVYNTYDKNDLSIISIFVWMILGETVQDINNIIVAYECKSPCDAENLFSHVNLREAKDYFDKEDGLELNWVIGYDDSEGTLYEKYGKDGIPYLLILDKKGNIYYTKAGYTDYNGLTEILDEIIN
ncbi:hypothetical protein AYK20_09460 [Thermoplasmatales archaeon SG8-52-1]|nr:MAG: hypothetical protein AYK20_09460 [Thermoplasmatales archaeon SG8-52-1]